MFKKIKHIYYHNIFMFIIQLYELLLPYRMRQKEIIWLKQLKLRSGWENSSGIHRILSMPFSIYTIGSIERTPCVKDDEKYIKGVI